MTALAVLVFITTAAAQDVRGLEVCTAEKDMTRRTSCLQANVEFLQQELTKQARQAKADLAALKSALERTQHELVELKKARPPEKK